MKTILLALFLFFGFVFTVLAQTKPSAQFEKRAKDVVAIINEPKDFEKVFSANFLADVPPAKFVEISKQLIAGYGKALKVEKVEASNDFSGKIFISFEKGFVAGMNLDLENKSPFLITGLLIVSTEKASTNSLENVVDELKKLPGQTALTVAKLDAKNIQPVIAYNSDKPLAIGSTFKLYILSELVRSINAGERKWSDVVELKNASLPSGMMQNWEAGAPVTLHTLASMMISISDNTATDSLLMSLGRERVEKMLTVAGNSNPNLSVPFMTTLELFKIKGGGKQKFAETYAAKDTGARRAMLAKEINDFKKEEIDLNFLKSPFFVSQIEWFASTDDLARLMNYLRLNTEKSSAEKARGVLTINKALPADTVGKWNYVGYKGGSETGVISMTYLLQSKKGEWFVVSGTWNDEKSPVKDSEFVLLMQQAIKILAEKMA
jgi:beta-lactamase class A